MNYQQCQAEGGRWEDNRCLYKSTGSEMAMADIDLLVLFFKEYRKYFIATLIPIFYFVFYLPFHGTKIIEISFIFGVIILLFISVPLIGKYWSQIKKMYFFILGFLTLDLIAVIIALNKIGFSRQVNILMTLLGDFAWWKLAIGYSFSAFALYLCCLASYKIFKEDYRYMWYILFIFWGLSAVRLILFTYGMYTGPMVPLVPYGMEVLP